MKEIPTFRSGQVLTAWQLNQIANMVISRINAQYPIKASILNNQILIGMHDDRIVPRRGLDSGSGVWVPYDGE